MGYYTRVLTTQADCIPIPALARALKEESCRAIIQTDDDPESWEQAVLTHPGGPEIAAMERNMVIDGSLGDEELQEFREELDGAFPKSGASWLQEFLPRVRCPIDSSGGRGGLQQRSRLSHSLAVLRFGFWQVVDGRAGEWKVGAFSDGLSEPAAPQRLSGWKSSWRSKTGMNKRPNHSMHRMGASRLGQLELVRQGRLAPTADGDRSATKDKR